MLTPHWFRPSSPDAGDAALAAFHCRLAALYLGPDAQAPATGCRKIIGNRDVPLPLPQWIKEMPKNSDTRKRAELRFLIRAAALFASPKGTVAYLSQACGLNDRALSTYTAVNCGRATINPRVAIKVEEACRGAVTRRQLNPEVFGD